MTQSSAFKVQTPTLLLDETQAQANIARMAAKARQSGVSFRPHFKTHQSATIGSLFRTHTVSALTVSSVQMGHYFADHGWDDITIAFPFNPLEHEAVEALARRVKLGVLVDSVAAAIFLRDHLGVSVRVWLEVDTGYHRTGLDWQDASTARDMAEICASAEHLTLVGLLTHAGHSYAARGADAIRTIWDETVTRLRALRNSLAAAGHEGLLLSPGDTPCCSVVDDFSAVDEIRPGNFVFYDVMQAEIGACTLDEIAVAVACPVVSVQPHLGQVAVYGGAVHLSKDSLTEADGRQQYGRVALWSGEGRWGPILPEARVTRLSQEHGLISVSPQEIEQISVGDVLAILPVHSCLTANLLKGYVTLDGQVIEMAAL